MKSNDNAKNIILSVLGLVMMIVGLVLVKSLSHWQGIMLTLPYVCVGVGAGVFGENLGSAIKNYLLKKDPQATKQIEIESKDERNMAISNKAKAKTYDLMLIIFAALIIAFGLMRAETYVVLVTGAAYLFSIVANIFYLVKYQKEM